MSAFMMQQIDEHKDAAMYNDYMGVSDHGRSQKYRLTESPKAHSNRGHSSYYNHYPPPYPSRTSRNYQSRRSANVDPSGFHSSALSRSESINKQTESAPSGPSRPYKNRYPPTPNAPYHSSYHDPPSSGYYPSSSTHRPFPNPYAQNVHPPPSHAPRSRSPDLGTSSETGSMYHSKSYTNRVGMGAPSGPTPYDYYSKTTHYTPSATPSSFQSPTMSPAIHHIPSKVSSSIKTPPPKIFEIPSKAPKLNNPPSLTPSKSPRSAVPPHSTLSTKSPEIKGAVDSDVLDSDLSTLSTIKSPKMLNRHVSEPDLKTMREIERDLEGLGLHEIPTTPPFGGFPGTGSSMDDLNLFSPGTEHDISLALGMPTDLSYSKTTPLHLDNDHEHSQNAQHLKAKNAKQRHFDGAPPPPHYAVNDAFYDRNGEGMGREWSRSRRSAASHRFPHRPPPGHGMRGRVRAPHYVEYGRYGPYPHPRGPPHHHRRPPHSQRPSSESLQQTQYSLDPALKFGANPYLDPSIPFMAPPSKAGSGSKAKSKRKKKGKKKESSSDPTNAGSSGSDQNGNGNALNALWPGPTGFDFAVHDLNQQLTVLQKDNLTVDQEIAATESRIKSIVRSLKKTESEKRRILKALELERMVLRKSLNESKETESRALDDDANGDGDGVEEGFDDVQIEEYWTKHCGALSAEIKKLEGQNQAISAASDVAHNALRLQLDGVRKQLDRTKKERATHRAKNMRFELEVIELSEKVNALRETVDAQRRDNFQRINKEKEKRQRERERLRLEEVRREKMKRIQSEETKMESDGDEDSEYIFLSSQTGISTESEILNVVRVMDEYPTEESIQNNLVRAQVEFYLSDYNLKRDKRLLEKICAEPQRGYLSTDDVLGLSRVRQLVSSAPALYAALCSSPYIDLILSEEEMALKMKMESEEKRKSDGEGDGDGNGGDGDGDINNNGDGDINNNGDGDGDGNDEDEECGVEFHPQFVGRARFSPPTEKQFPFRRSVYLYGLPWYADDDYIYSMLRAFGGVTKVQFDHGPDTLDREIQRKMLDKDRVYKLLSKDSSALTMEFNAMHNDQETYDCYWCQKRKPCADGYYHPQRAVGQSPSYRVCLQCAAAKSEEQSAKYDSRRQLLKDEKCSRLRELLLGLPPRALSNCKTALCVFASQRQASKCVYVRSRLAYDGAFATHYHHYSKLKKEIALSAATKPKQTKNSNLNLIIKPSLKTLNEMETDDHHGNGINIGHRHHGRN